MASFPENQSDSWREQFPDISGHIIILSCILILSYLVLSWSLFMDFTAKSPKSARKLNLCLQHKDLWKNFYPFSTFSTFLHFKNFIRMSKDIKLNQMFGVVFAQIPHSWTRILWIQTTWKYFSIYHLSALKSFWGAATRRISLMGREFPKTVLAKGKCKMLPKPSLEGTQIPSESCKSKEENNLCLQKFQNSLNPENSSKSCFPLKSNSVEKGFWNFYQLFLQYPLTHFL